MKVIRSYNPPSGFLGRSPEVHALALIGAELRATYDASLNDPMTTRLIELIGQLAAKDERQEKLGKR